MAASGADEGARRMNATLRTVATRRFSDGATACNGPCVARVFGSTLTEGFGPVYGRARSDVPLACVCCGEPVANVPTALGLYRNLEAWVNHESLHGLDVGARGAYARLTAVAMEGALGHEWDRFYAAQPEVQAAHRLGSAVSQEHWDNIYERVLQRADLVPFYVRADGTWLVAPVTSPPADWVAFTSLRVYFDNDEKGSEGVWNAVTPMFEETFRGAALVRDQGAHIVLPCRTFQSFEVTGKEAQPHLVVENEPPLSLAFPEVRKIASAAQVVALDHRRPSLGITS